MFVSAKILAMECGVTEKTILAHVRQMERDGHHVRARIGRPMRINREEFLRLAFPGWKDEEESDGE